MALPRRKYVQEGKVGVYHCTTRCVRRAFLCGSDSQTGRDFSHRKQWIHDRLQFLTSIFAVDISSFSVMANHYHVTVRIRPDIVQSWSDYDVASRWLTLCPKRYRSKKKAKEPIEQQIRELASCPERVAELRKRLCCLSWFMKYINEFIARAANKEDNVKGRFWESRFKCQALLDPAAIAVCMVYVDLNPIRAGLASSPEQSDFTSIQERIRAWKAGICEEDVACNNHTLPTHSSWLCPISSQNEASGILPMTTQEYFDLVDKSGRMVRADKRGVIDAGLEPILKRIGAKSHVWTETVSHFGGKFRLAAGLVSSLRSFADRIGQRWITGLTEADNAFTASPLEHA